MDWNIKERAEKCSITGKLFEEDEIFYTILSQENGELIRQDLCAQAWDNRSEEEGNKSLSFWRAAFKPTPPEPAEAIEQDSAEAELRRLLKQNGEGNEKLAYLLTLLLERKRIFHEREKSEIDGKKVVIYEHVDTQETFIVPWVNIKIAEVESLQQELKNSSPIFA